jgi:hypothetical protein
MTNLYDMNLYDMLRGIEADGPGQPISLEMFELAQHLLAEPGHELHLRASPTAPDSPVLRIHGAVKGNPADVFGLLLEAMYLNPTLAQMVLAAGHKYATMTPLCRMCNTRHAGRGPDDCPQLDGGPTTWEFKQRNR